MFAYNFQLKFDSFQVDGILACVIFVDRVQGKTPTKVFNDTAWT